MPVRPLSPYAVDKLASEHACQVYTQLYGLDTVALRYFNVYGPRQDPSSPYSGVISIFSDSIHQGNQPTIFGDGEQTRDFVYVSDVVEANIRAATAPAAAGKAINVATGTTITINELLSTICRIQGQPCDPARLPAREGDIRHSCADVTLAGTVLGWTPGVDFETGLRRLFENE
jgi:UDP-glucose 4-epimerase